MDTHCPRMNSSVADQPAPDAAKSKIQQQEEESIEQLDCGEEHRMEEQLIENIVSQQHSQRPAVHQVRKQHQRHLGNTEENGLALPLPAETTGDDNHGSQRHRDAGGAEISARPHQLRRSVQKLDSQHGQCIGNSIADRPPHIEETEKYPNLYRCLGDAQQGVQGVCLYGGHGRFAFSVGHGMLIFTGRPAFVRNTLKPSFSNTTLTIPAFLRPVIHRYSL